MKLAILTFIHKAGAAVGVAVATIGAILPVAQVLSPKAAAPIVIAGAVLAGLGKGLQAIEDALNNA